MAIEALVADITGSALLVGDVIICQARATKQVSEIIATSSLDTRATKQIAEILAVSSANTRVTKQFVEVLAPYAVIEDLATDITSSALVGANLSNMQYLAVAIVGSALVAPNLVETTKVAVDINGSALIGADLRATISVAIIGNATVAPYLFATISAAITGNATVAPNLATPQPLVPWGGIVGSATLGILLDKNIQHTSSTISFTQSAEHLNWPAGNLLQLTQNAVYEIISNSAASNTLTLTQDASVLGVLNKSVTSVLGSLDHSASFVHVLPTETASSTLVLTDSADWARAAQNTLNLTQLAEGVIGGIPGIASNTLSLTSTATVNVVYNLSASNTLILTQEAEKTSVMPRSASNNLSLNQLVLHITLDAKNYVILQAPFSFLQTSIVLSAPLWGDTENITSEMSLRRSMNGGTKTFVKTNKNRRLNYTFRVLDEAKAIELLEFCRFYNSDLIRLTNWKGEIWKVNLLTNPIDFVQTRRYGTDVSLEFEGELING